MKKILLILALISMIVFPIFAVSGTYTTNEYFYMPGYGSYGTTEFDEYNAYMQIADTQIKANKDAFDNFEVGDITDIDLTDIANLKILKYNSTTEKWECEDDGGGSGAVDTSGTPVQYDIARFTDADTIEGRSYSELKADLDLEISTDVQAQDAGLQSIADLTTSANDMIYTTALDTYAIMDTFAELQAVVADKTLVNEEDIFTIDANWVNTANPWADDEVANDITINLATLATTFTCTDNESEALNCPIVFVDGATGAQGAETDGDLHYNPSTGLLTATGFAGALTGNADTVTTNANLTGIVTSAGNATAIANKAIAIAKLADGTDGELITWDASGVITTVPVGTATHVLTSGGTGVAPTFQAVSATDITVADTTDTTCWVGLWESVTGSQAPKSDAGITYNAGTGMLTVTGVTAPLTGNADTCTTASAGDAAVDFFGAGVDAVTDATTCTDVEGTLLSIAAGTLNAAIPADHITYDMMQDTTDTDKVLGRSTAGAGTVEEIACTSAGRALIDDADASAQRTTLGLVIGTNILAEQNIGIADDNLLEVDDADAADNDFAKFTANGLEGRSYSETMEDLNPITTKTGIATLTVAEAGTVLVSAAAAYTLTLPTAVGHAGLTYHFVKTDANYNLITLDGNAAETIDYENSTSAPCLTYLRLNTYRAEVTLTSDNANWQVIDEAMGQVPECKVYISATQADTVSGAITYIEHDTEVYDIGGNYDISTWISGNCTSTSASHIVDTGGAFVANMVGKRVKNTTDTTYTYITAYNSATDVTVRDNIFVDTEGYEVKHSKFVAPIAGKYQFFNTVAFSGGSVVVDKKWAVGTYKNYTSNIGGAYNHSSIADTLVSAVVGIGALAVDDIITPYIYHVAGVNTVDLASGTGYPFIIKLVSKD